MKERKSPDESFSPGPDIIDRSGVLPPGKPTVRDIAELAGVSHSTVSRALNGSPLISTDTRERVCRIAENIGFEFNEGARRLKNRKTGIIGVIYYSSLNDFRSSLYTNELFRDLRHNLERVGLDALLVEAWSEKLGQSNIVRLIRQNKVDGFIIIHPGIRPEDYELARAHQLPVVHLHTVPELIPRESFDCFFTDNFQGGRLAGEHLLDSGCKNIQVVRINEKKSEEFRMRTAGCLDAVKKAGFSIDETHSFSCSCSYEGGYQIVRKNLRYLKRLDGIFIPADITAFGVLNALREEGFLIPEDMKVIGFDDSPVSRMTLPPLTTVHQPRELLSELACRRVHSLLFEDSDQKPVLKYLEPSLVIRESTSETFRRG